jgi:hypothetical protein
MVSEKIIREVNTPSIVAAHQFAERISITMSRRFHERAIGPF